MKDSYASETLLLGIETGGTKIVCAAAAGGNPTIPVARKSIPTRTPASAVGDIASFVASLPGLVGGVGIAAFGPLDLDAHSLSYGSITSTPKPGWDNFDLLGAIQGLLPGVPTSITTDVAGAAYGEAHRGAIPGVRELAYVTVGTGVGVGLLRSGELVVGSGWPEVAHIPVQRHPDDSSAGVCRFHGDCLEGLASGPAISTRNLELQKTRVARSADQDVDITAFYLAQLVAVLYYAFGSERVVLGGGVMKTPGIIEAVRRNLATRIGPSGARGSSRSLWVDLTALDGDAGLVGALLLAERVTANHRRDGPALRLL